MSESRKDEPRRVLASILIPLLATFIILRVYLHRIDIHNHLFLGGYWIHHIFVGLLMAIPSAFVLAFDPSSKRARTIARMILGLGSALILDQVIYLIATKGDETGYLSAISFWGAVTMVTLASFLLVALRAFVK